MSNTSSSNGDYVVDFARDENRTLLEQHLKDLPQPSSSSEQISDPEIQQIYKDFLSAQNAVEAAIPPALRELIEHQNQLALRFADATKRRDGEIAQHTRLAATHYAVAATRMAAQAVEADQVKLRGAMQKIIQVLRTRAQNETLQRQKRWLRRESLGRLYVSMAVWSAAATGLMWVWKRASAGGKENSAAMCGFVIVWYVKPVMFLPLSGCFVLPTLPTYHIGE